MEDKSVEKGAKKLVEGHYSGDLKAMCIHPKSGCFYTGGEDRRLIKWKFATEKRAEKIQALTNIIRCLDVNGNLNTLAVGFSNGTVEFYDA
jgi:WD40 repeat protein